MKTYKSGISWALFAPIFVLLGSVAFAIAFENIWVALLLVLPIIIFIVTILANTHYSISDTVLYIKSGFLFQKKIEIAKIKKIQDTTSILSSPANSFKNRIEIRYNKWDSIILSPKDKEDFINHLFSLNSSIEVKTIRK